MRYLISLLFMLSVLTVTLSLRADKPKYTIAFGYMHNKSGDENYDYLESIFPNNFANTLRLKFNADVLKPHEINTVLKKNKKKLKLSYRPEDIPKLTSQINTDCFIYGHFVPLPENRIRCVINIYKKGSKMMFTFTSIGRLETEIFKLVDKITLIMVDYLSDKMYYRKTRPSKGSKIAILCNLDGSMLNNLMIPFMQKGYRISGVNASTMKTPVTRQILEHLSRIKTRKAAFDYISRYRKFRFLYGTWASRRYVKKINAIKRVFAKYDLKVLATKEAVLRRFNRELGVRYLMIMYFRGTKKKKNQCWVRMIDCQSRELVYMEREIKGINVTAMAKKIIKRFEGKPSKK